MKKAIHETRFDGLKQVQKGKVRDVYEVEEGLVLVATDRISAYDVVMSEPVPDKGIVLTQISRFFFENVAKNIIRHHMISCDVKDFPESCQPYASDMAHRTMLVEKAKPLPIECIVRGYVSGSGWKSYQKTGQICGIGLPEGLTESDKLPSPIFTPSTKAEQGLHDENIDFDTAARLVGDRALAEKVRDASLALYETGAELARTRGIIIADTKFEFGMLDGELVLIDEMLTPDSSRFWPLSDYAPGGAQKSFDKQFLRDYLTAQNWDKKPPPPKLPEEIIFKTRSKYVEAYERLTQETYDF